MAILNEDAKREIYKQIGYSSKSQVLEKSKKQRHNLAQAGVIILAIGLLLMVLVPAFAAITVHGAFSRFIYYLTGLIISLIGIALIILGAVLYSNTKKKYSYDDYAYGEEHFPDYLVDNIQGRGATSLHTTISYFNDLVRAEFISRDTKSERKHSGRSTRTVTYYIDNYKFIYRDGSVRTVSYNSQSKSDSFNKKILCYYLYDDDKGENN